MKKLVSAAAVLAVALIATVYASPYYAVHQIKTELAEHDAAALAGRVDFPALRDSVKAQLNGAMADSVKAVGASDNPFAAMGQAVAGAMLGKMIDAMVTPAGVMAMVNQSALGASAHSERDQSVSASAPAKADIDYAAGYAAWDKFVIRAKQESDSNSGALVLRRHGLWSWKLSAIEVSRG